MIAAPQARDREAAARALRDAVRAQGAAARAAGAAARGTRGHGDRGRPRRREAPGAAGRRDAAPGSGGTPARKPLPGAPAARARRRPGADLLRGLRLGADRQAGRGRHRDAGGDPAPLEGDPDRAREVHLPGLRDDQPAAGAVPATPRGWAGPNLLAMILFEKFGQHQPLNRQSRALCARGRRAQPLDARRPGRRLRRRAGAAARPDRRACAGGRAAARRRHPGAGAGQGQDRSPAGSGSTSATTAPSPAAPRPPRSSATRATGAASIPQPHLAGWSGILQADAYAGFGGLYDPRPRAGAGHRGAVLGAWPAQVLRARRHRRAARAAAGAADLAARLRGGAPHRRHLRRRARRSTASTAERASRRPASRRRARWSPTSRPGCAASGPALAPCAGRQGDGLHAEALGRPSPRFLDDGRICLTQQRRRARPARHRPRQKGLALRRLRPRRRAGRLHVHA